MSRSRVALWLAALAVAVALGVVGFLVTHRGPAGSASGPAATTVEATYVGSEACARCHAAEAKAWQGSQHQRAMQTATDATVIGNFADASFARAGVTSAFFRRDGKYFVRTDGPDGELADFEVKYTFGVYPLQQYLVELPRGHVQALPIAWDARPAEQGGQRWFHLYPDEKIDHADELHWTRRQQNWNYMCADCHSTNVRKQYDAATDTFATTYSEISVGCEACHGPGSAHVAWADRKGDAATKGLTVRFGERKGVSWSRDPQTGKPRRSTPRTTAVEIDVCAQCHARRSQVAEGYRPGRPFMDHYLPSLLSPALYHADGQQQDEVFIWGSWLQSRMHSAGVTCSDCHDPHTQKLRLPGNATCAQCHDPSKYDVTAHHRHPQGSTGAQCVDCHMRRETYMVVDPRRDHSMRVPRPDQSVTLGVPNACNDCHRESDARWAAEKVRDWLGRDARGSESFAPTFAAAERGESAALRALVALAQEPSQPAIVRASALERRSLAGAYDPDAVARAVSDAEPLVRLGAVRLAEAAPPQERRILTPLLTDPVRSVRSEAARVTTASVGLLPDETRALWQRAADEYVATLHYAADRPESNVALGTFYATLGRNAEAQAAFEAALRLDARFEPAYVNAADALRAQGDDTAGIAMLRRGLEAVPDAASLHHALGLALVRQGDTAAAVDALARAARLAPDTARYVYVHAVALNSTGRSREAIAVLQAAEKRWPNDRDVLFALASFQAQAGDLAAARKTAARMLERFPDDAEVRALAAQLGR